jgi:UDP-glucose:(heptosyl)LPS alpha-1,3-glucosyltransferase
LPARGGCETYIADLSRRLAADGHEVHLYACRWDESALPKGIVYHRLKVQRGSRAARPWRFGSACESALANAHHDVTIGFDKTWGQDVLYPQGGLHAASAVQNIHKYASPRAQRFARLLKKLDPAAKSFARLERKQYFESPPRVIVVNSEMVRQHFGKHYGIAPETITVVHSAIDPARFRSADRWKIREKWRQSWGIEPDEPVALLVAMNYRLKGLEPLLHALTHVPAQQALRLVVVGHPKFGRYRRLARRLGVAHRVVFHGFCAETRNAYFASDFLVHPTFYDPCSLVVLEALACGLPVITSRFNGASELLEPPYDSLLIDDPHHHQALAAALCQMAEPGRRALCAQAARHAAGHWTFEHHYHKMMQVFRDVAARKQAA